MSSILYQFPFCNCGWLCGWTLPVPPPRFSEMFRFSVAVVASVGHSDTVGPALTIALSTRMASLLRWPWHSHLLCLVISSLTVFFFCSNIPLRSCLSLGHSRRYTDPWFSSVSSHSLSLSGCSAAGHSLDCLMFPCTLLYFSTEQRHLLLLHIRGLITHQDDQGMVEFFRIVF